MSDEQKPTNKSIIEGTTAQALGGAVAVLFVTTLASFDHFLQAGAESALGTVFGIVFYFAFKKLRQ